MPTPICLIDDSLTSAMFAHPIERGWVEADGFELVPDLRAEQVAERGACALIGSIEAALLMEDYAIVTDVALVSRHVGGIALLTPRRPDEIEKASVALGSVSRTAEAVARATIGHFYGIEITGWEREEATDDAVVVEGAGALQRLEDGHLGDLVRAWFILSGSPLPTHLLVVPKQLANDEPDAVESIVNQLVAAFDTGIERRREMRRNLSDAHGIDRDRLIEFQSDQIPSLSKSARKAWLDILRRTNRAMKLPTVSDPTVITVGKAPEED